MQTSPPCANMGLSKHGGPVFPHVWAFSGTIVFAVSILRECGLYLCVGLQSQSHTKSKCWCRFNSVCSCALGCVLACWTPFGSHEQFSSYCWIACHIPVSHTGATRTMISWVPEFLDPSTQRRRHIRIVYVSCTLEKALWMIVVFPKPSPSLSQPLSRPLSRKVGKWFLSAPVNQNLSSWVVPELCT